MTQKERERSADRQWGRNTSGITTSEERNSFVGYYVTETKKKSLYVHAVQRVCVQDQIQMARTLLNIAQFF